MPIDDQANIENALQKINSLQNLYSIIILLLFYYCGMFGMGQDMGQNAT
jgi:hypothetical protein